jgi:hypothetical protein
MKHLSFLTGLRLVTWGSGAFHKAGMLRDMYRES